MGKIFGISDLPVTIFTTPLGDCNSVPKPKETIITKPIEQGLDLFVLQNKTQKTKEVVKFTHQIENFIKNHSIKMLKR